VDRIFQQVTLRSCFQRAKNLNVALVGRQHDHFRVGKFSVCLIWITANRRSWTASVHLSPSVAIDTPFMNSFSYPLPHYGARFIEAGRRLSGKVVEKRFERRVIKYDN